MILIPGKIFIFGEYSVMNGGQAIIAAVKPTYQYSSVPFKANDYSTVHPESPAGLFSIQNSAEVCPSMVSGIGAGFGSSTAELIAANQLLAKPWNENELFAWYREKCAPASGADLVVQEMSRTQGTGIYQFKNNANQFEISRFEIPKDILENLFVFQTPRSFKVETHEDLKTRSISSLSTQKANDLISQWMKNYDPKIFNLWAEFMNRSGLESNFARTVRETFEDVAGVNGVKGCGAGLNDIFLVSASPHSKLDLVAKKFNLTRLGKLSDHV